MKKLILSLIAAPLFLSCGLLQGSSNTTSTAASSNTTTTAAAAPSAAVTSGQAAGNALSALYTQYKTDGKYDYKNVNNAINATLLLANIADLPKNVKNSSYLKEFSQGLMASSAGLVTKNNVTAVTDNLTTLATEYAKGVAEKTSEKTTEAANQAAATTSSIADKLNTAATTASSISSLLSIFSGK